MCTHLAGSSVSDFFSIEQDAPQGSDRPDRFAH